MATETRLGSTGAPRTDVRPHVTLFVDGLVEPINPGGYCCWAWVAFDAGGLQLAQDYGCLGRGAGMTNNRAVYESVLQALRYAQSQGWTPRIRSDSQLVTKQILDQWNCNAPGLIPLYEEAKRIGRQLGGRIKWIPRIDNQLADSLSRAAYSEARAGRRMRGAA